MAIHKIETAELLYYYEVSETEQWVIRDLYQNSEGPFFCYRGAWYDINEAMRTDKSFWHGVIGISNTAALLVHLHETPDEDDGFITVAMDY